MRNARPLALLLTTLLLPFAALPTSSTPGPVVPRGQPMFWEQDVVDVEPVAVSHSQVPFDCQTTPERCYAHAVPVTTSPASSVLRIAFDTADFEDFFTVEIHDPAGEMQESYLSVWSHESYFTDPMPGDWQVRIFVDQARGASYRLRAFIEAPATHGTAVSAATHGAHVAAQAHARPLLPNLRSEPSMDIHFRTVAVPLHSAWQPVDVPGATCMPDEVAEEGAVHCLRFSFGYGNWGEGPYRVEFSPLAVGPPAVRQVIFHSDGSRTVRDAGEYEYHKTHLHYHYEDLFWVKLLRVTDIRSGATEPAQESPKRGACAHDWRIVDWYAANNARQHSADSQDGCDALPGGSPAEGAAIALSPGWADIYPWTVNMNYVEFAGQPDGCYVLWSMVDPLGRLQESREDDNEAYAYFQVQGTGTRIIERGHGSSPWDARKTVVEEHEPCTA